MRLKRLSYYQGKAWYTLLTSSELKWYLCTFLYHPQNVHPFEGHEMLSTMCSNAIKSNKLKVDGSLTENKLVSFINSKGSFQVLSLVCDFWKKILHATVQVHVSSPWWWPHLPKILIKQSIQRKLWATIPILSALRNYLHV